MKKKILLALLIVVILLGAGGAYAYFATDALKTDKKLFFSYILKNNMFSDFEDERLIPARLAPSAINSQPWYFKHTDDGFDVYQVKQNIIKRQVLKKWNPVDMGIALAHMYVANENTFEFEIKNSFEDLKGYAYIGSIKI